jgi:alpha-L-rhamnosidase
VASITNLTTQYPNGLIGVGDDSVRLSWQIDAPSSNTQTSAHIQVSHDADFDDILAETQLPGPDQVAVMTPGGVWQSREVRHYRVRAQIDESWTAWSEPCSAEIGLLEGADWTGSAITLADDPGSREPSPSPLLRTEFDIAAPIVSARLYVTSLGAYEMFVNGAEVTDALLSPGWSSYGKRIVANTYDVTSLVRVGRNALGGVLGDGWYRGRLGWNPDKDRCHYGSELGLLAQLEVTRADGTTISIVTDESWRAATGSIRRADIYDGCTIDLRDEPDGWKLAGFDASSWSNAHAVPIDVGIVQPWISAPIRAVHRFDVQVSESPNRSTRVDVGQNIAGFLEITVRGAADTVVTTHHAEVVEPDGSLHLRALRTAKASDQFVLADGNPVTLVPAFTFHGFRYADITTDAEILDVVAVAISSDLATRSSFSSSHAGLNKFESNVRWSQRDNFVGLPTDCPQRDERLGWTGDAQAFAATANVLFDSHQFWLNWFRDLSLDQTDDGVPSVVPDVVLDGEARTGRAGWADAATVAPWAAYEAYGSTAALEQQIDSMVRWVATLTSKRRADGLLGGEFQFGDWLDPDAPSDEPWKAKCDGDFLANAFFAHSARLTARAAAVLGLPSVATEHDQLADEIAELTWKRWRDHALESQTGCAVAVELAIAPIAERPPIASTLAALVREADGAVSTGFLGTPLVLPALSRFGHFDEAFMMLLRTGVRSWLYQVANDATTVWERWDAIKPDGSIHDGRMTPFEGAGDAAERGEGNEPHMLSFNHYAYGAVIDWVYRHVGGVAPDADAPGYRRVVLAPRPCAAIRAASTTISTGLGDVAFQWRLDGDSLRASATLPFGSTGVLAAPVTDHSTVTIDGQPAAAEATIGHGTHVIVVTEPAIAPGGEDS